jgi:hypothetical protein
MCCVTPDQPAARELFYAPQPTFIIPIFRAPTTTSTLRTSTGINKIVSAILKQENKQSDVTSTLSTNMISQRIFENLVLTNTIVAAFCIVLMVTITGFLIFLLVPSIRRRWINEQQKEERKLDDLSTLSRQQSFRQFTLSPNRLNPLFEQTTGTTTQFGALFHPHTTTATLLHPTIWTPMTPTSVVSTPLPNQQPQMASPPQSPKITRPATIRPPQAPSHPPTQAQRSPRKR